MQMIAIVVLSRFLCIQGTDKENSKLIRPSAGPTILQQTKPFFLFLAAFNEEQLQKLNLDPPCTKKIIQ